MFEMKWNISIIANLIERNRSNWVNGEKMYGESFTHILSQWNEDVNAYRNDIRVQEYAIETNKDGTFA